MSVDATSALTETCQVCESKPVCRVVDVGDRVVRVCARCSETFRREPATVIQAVRDAHANEGGVA
jgi:hypothetical protein